MEDDSLNKLSSVEKKTKKDKTVGLFGYKTILANVGLSLALLSACNPKPYNEVIQLPAESQVSSMTQEDYSPRSFFKRVAARFNAVTDHLSRDVNTQSLIDWMSDVPGSDGYKYNLRDNQGVGMDSVKIIENSVGGGYLAVYHHEVGGIPQSRLATSQDLFNWDYKTVLEPASSQATIVEVPNKGYIVALEKIADGTKTCENKGGCNMFKYYPNIAALYAGASQRSLVIPRTLSACNEGTPNIYSASLYPDIDHSTIEIGFHFHQDCEVDRQARGRLINFRNWETRKETHLNEKFEELETIEGNVGDRDAFLFGGKEYLLIEGQYRRNDFRTWRPYLYDPESDQLALLEIKTHKGHHSFGNSSFTNLTLPNGKEGFVVSQFLFTEGVKSSEDGSLIYYKENPPVFFPPVRQGDILVGILLSLIIPKIFHSGSTKNKKIN